MRQKMDFRKDGSDTEWNKQKHDTRARICERLLRHSTLLAMTILRTVHKTNILCRLISVEYQN